MKHILRLVQLLVISIVAMLITNSEVYSQWRKLAVYPSTFFNEVFFVDAQNGWIAQFSNTVLRTTDAGTTWRTSTLPSGTFSFNRDICFINTSVGFISGEDGIWKTSDGGATWANITPTGAANGYQGAMWFRDANTGIWGRGTCADSTVTFYCTTDAGSTWSSYTSVHTLDVSVGGMTYANGYFHAAGGGGRVWRSSDDGATWSHSLSGTSASGWIEDLTSYGSTLYGASANGASCSSTGGGVVLRSFDNGASWSRVAFPSVVMWGVSMYSANEGWSCGDNGHAFKTTDGGASWIELSCGMNRTDRIDDIHFTSATNGWAVGDGIYKYVGDTLTAGPDTIDFGDVLVGVRSRDSIATLTALGSPVRIMQRVLTGNDSAQFGSSGSLGLQDVVSCQVGRTPVYFAPTSEGVKLARLEFVVSGRSTNSVVYLRGRGVRPKINSGIRQEFDTLYCGVPRRDSITFENQGTYPLTITGVQFIGSVGATYRLVNPSPPFTISPGALRRVYLEATPTAAGSHSATMSVYSNDTGQGRSPWNVALRGFAQEVGYRFNLPGGTIVLAPLRRDSVANGCILYTNTGNGPQTIVEIFPIDNDPAIQIVPGAVGNVVAPGASQGICFTASSSDTGTHIKRFRVKSQPCNVDTVITVIYRIAAPLVTLATEIHPIIECSGSRLDTIVITNSGDLPLIISGAPITGAFASEYDVVSPTLWPDTLGAGGVLPIVIRFSPSVAGAPEHPATLRLITNDATSEHTVMLLGRLDRPDIEVMRRHVDVGDICVGEWSDVVLLPLHNNGSIASRISSFEARSATAAEIESGPIPTTIPAGASDTLRPHVRAMRSGAFSLLCILQSEPCGGPDTILVVGRGVAPDLVAVPERFEFGSLRSGTLTTRTVRVRNNGNVPVTIDRWEFIPPVDGARVVAPIAGSTIDPDQEIDVTVELSVLTEGRIETTLLGIPGDGSCGDTLIAGVSALFSNAPLLLSHASITLGSDVPCQTGRMLDTVRLRNDGTLPVTLRSVRFESTVSSFEILSAPPPLYVLAPAEESVVIIAMSQGLMGLARDTLRIDYDGAPDSWTVRIPIDGERQVASHRLLKLVGNDPEGDTIELPGRTKCSPEVEFRLRLKNDGSVADTFSIEAAGGFGVISPSSVALAAGDSREIILGLLSASPEDAFGSLLIESALCGAVSRRVLRSAFDRTGGYLPSSDLGIIPIGGDTTVTVALTASARDRRVADIVLNPTDAPFTVTGLVAGDIIPANSASLLKLTARPSVVGPSLVAIMVILDEPCPDTIHATATVRGIAHEKRPAADLTLPEVRGRWGTHIVVPVTISVPAYLGTVAADSLAVTITSDPWMLDPLSANVGGALNNDWRIEERGYDRSNGTYSFVLLSTHSGASLPSGTDRIIAEIEYNVLRGPHISTPLTITGFSDGFAVRSHPGTFALEDYCNAYGRLLETRGVLALDRNVPNPFNSTTSIEFETPFYGHVLITLHNVSGREVMRLVDEELPAGRRRIEIDASDLPSGVYTYRMSIGLQKLARQMLLVK